MINPDIIQRVAARVAEVLALEPEEVQPESRLMDDLGADSLDLVELMYLLENEFDIRLTQQDMSLTAQLGIPEDQIHQNEIITPTALGLLRQRFPHAAGKLTEGMQRNQLASLVTVEEVARSVARRLEKAS